MHHSSGALFPENAPAYPVSTPVPTAKQITLRPYQEQDRDEMRTLLAEGKRRVLLVQPTGAGKGTLASFMVHGAVARKLRVMFWVNRRTLVHDMSKRLDTLGVDHGVIMSNHPRRRPWLNVHVASIDSLRNRQALPPADLVIIDEAHFACSDGWKQMMAKYPDARFILMTATPVRLDGKGLAEIADVMVPGPSVQELIDHGYLVPSRVFSPSEPDMKQVGHSNGDFNQKQLAAACDKTKLVGDIVKTWLLRASDRKSVFFGVDKAHAEHVAEEFLRAGVKATVVHDKTPDAERDSIWNDFDHGDLKVICSVGVISYGWDHSVCACIILGRPTEAVSLHLQQLGRGSRPHPGKTDFLVLDHAGNTARHGFYEDEREWSLTGGCVNKRMRDKTAGVAICRHCFMTYKSGAPKCPECGFVPPINSRKVEVLDGSLEEIKREVKLKRMEEWRLIPDDEKKRKFLEFRKTGAERGYSKSWAFVRFSKMFGEPVPKEWLGGSR